MAQLYGCDNPNHKCYILKLNSILSDSVSSRHEKGPLCASVLAFVHVNHLQNQKAVVTKQCSEGVMTCKMCTRDMM